jgi:hypothetical protein
MKGPLDSISGGIMVENKLVRCNPDVAPRLTSGGYEDKVDVITPINILFIKGGKF